MRANFPHTHNEQQLYRREEQFSPARVLTASTDDSTPTVLRWYDNAKTTTNHHRVTQRLCLKVTVTNRTGEHDRVNTAGRLGVRAHNYQPLTTAATCVVNLRYSRALSPLKWIALISRHQNTTITKLHSRELWFPPANRFSSYVSNKTGTTYSAISLPFQIL